LDERGNLAGRTALIAGGAGGLGRACADDLGRAGVRLALCDRNPDLVADAVSSLERDNVEVIAELLDVRQPDQLTAFFARAADAFGGSLDIVVNVVGGSFPQLFADSNPRGWDAVIRTNFTWLLHSTQLAIPLMRSAGGSIINITSIEGHRGAPSFAVYGAMKAAVTSLSRSLAVELGPLGIRVNTIAPDLIPTEGMAHIDASDPRADAILIPMARRGTYADLGGCALFLASDLSQYVTGTSLHPDGGAFAASGWLNWPGHGFHPGVPPLMMEELSAKFTMEGSDGGV
jgi:3-oxoacyl-[acyl-carrier protein] reductase